MFLSSIFLLGDYKLQRVLYWFVYLFFVFSSKRSDKLENSWKFGIQNSFFLIQCDKHLPHHYISMCTPNIFFLYEKYVHIEFSYFGSCMNTSAQTKKCPTSCARSLQSSIMTPIFYVDFWMISPLSKNYEEYFYKMYNFLLHCFTGEVLSFPIMVPAWILQLQQKNAQPLVQDPCKAEPFVDRTEMSIPRNVKWKGKLVGKSSFF